MSSRAIWMETRGKMRTTLPDSYRSSRNRCIVCGRVCVISDAVQVNMGLNAEEVMIEMVEDNA